MLKAVVFDLDRTLVDLAAARARFAAEHRATGAPTSGHRIQFCARVAAHSDVAEGLIRAAYERTIARHVQFHVGAATLVESLSSEYRLVVLSNGATRTQLAKARAALGDAIDHIERVLVSEEIGFHKPQRRAFELALEVSGTDADHTLFVGDDYERDIHPAGLLGAPTCHLDPTSSDHRPSTYRISSLQDLREVLRC